MPRPSGSPSVSRAIVKLPPACDSQMYCINQTQLLQALQALHYASFHDTPSLQQGSVDSMMLLRCAEYTAILSSELKVSMVEQLRRARVYACMLMQTGALRGGS